MAAQQAPAANGSLRPQYHGCHTWAPASAQAADNSPESLAPQHHGYPNLSFPTRPTATPTWATLPAPNASSAAILQPPASTSASRHDFDTTGQVAPPGMRPRVTATLWEDEGTLCFEVDARGICVARREDNHMINGTKLLNVAGMARATRDGILKSEKRRHVVKLGPMHLKGVWIPFERALDFANRGGITDLLYPLFVHNIGILLGHPINSRSNISRVARKRPQPSPGNALTLLPPPPTSAQSRIPNAAQQYPLFTPDNAFAPRELPTPETSESSVPGDCASPASLATHSTLPNWRQFIENSPPPSPHGDSEGARMEPVSLSRAGSTAPDTASRLAFPILCAGSERDTRPDADLATRVSLVSSLDQSPATSETGTISSKTASDYTASSGEDETPLTLADQKRALLKRLMRFFYLIISTRPSPAGHVRNRGSGQTQTASSPSNYRSTVQQSHGPSTIPSSRKGAAQKRPRGDGDDDEKNNSEDRDNKRLRPSGSGTLIDPESGRLACPFFKHNQGRYRMWRACPGPGWATVHRIKEHVYRKHALPIRCPRCHKVFDTERQKDDHISQEERCAQTEDTSPPEGIDADKTRLLRSRKGKNKEASEVDKWNEMYMILFPEADSANLPSPYYDYSTESPAPGSPGGEFVRYEQFLRRELPGRVRQELETRIEERLNPMEETLRGELVEIVRDMQLQLFELYKASRSQEPEDTGRHAPSPQEEDVTPAAQVASAAQDMGPLEAFVQPPLINSEDWSSFCDFGGQMWDPSRLDSRTLWAGDSGYDSSQADRAIYEDFGKIFEGDWEADGDPEL